MERRKFTREFKLEAVRLIKDRGVSYVQASQDLGVHTSQLRDWVKKFADDPQHAFPGQGQMKPEQLEIARLKREVTKLRAERDILKTYGPPRPQVARFPRLNSLQKRIRPSRRGVWPRWRSARRSRRSRTNGATCRTTTATSPSSARTPSRCNWRSAASVPAPRPRARR